MANPRQQMTERFEQLLRQRLLKAIEQDMDTVKGLGALDVQIDKPARLTGLLKSLGFQPSKAGATRMIFIAPTGKRVEVPRLLTDPEDIDDFVTAIVQATSESAAKPPSPDEVIARLAAQQTAKTAKAAKPTPPPPPPPSAAKPAAKPTKAATKAAKAAAPAAEAAEAPPVKPAKAAKAAKTAKPTAKAAAKAAKAAKPLSAAKGTVVPSPTEPLTAGDKHWLAQILRAARKHARSALPPAAAAGPLQALGGALGRPVDTTLSDWVVRWLGDQARRSKWVDARVIDPTGAAAAGAAAAAAGAPTGLSPATLRLLPEGTAAAAGAGGGGLGGGGAGGGAAAGGGRFLRRLMRKPYLNRLAGGMLAYLIVDSLLSAAQSGVDTRLKMEAMDMLQRAAMPAESAYLQQMLPLYDQRVQAAQAMLMRQLASGEELIR